MPALPSGTPESARAVPTLRPVWSATDARSREAQALDAAARLAGGLARDFNDALTVIVGQAERALALLGPDHPARAALLEIEASGRAAAEATHDLLAISRRQVLAPQSVDLNTIVRSLVRTLPATLPAGVHAQFDLSPAPLAIDIDAAQITRAVTGLVTFLCDLMPSGGTISFATRTTEVGRAKTVRLSVTGTGQGLTEEVRLRLFEPFVASPGRRKGLALSVAHGIVAQSGGALSVDSAPRGGTAFTLALPVMPRTERPAAPVSHEPAAGPIAERAAS